MRRTMQVDTSASEVGFGRPNRPSTPMKSVMQGDFENDAVSVQHLKNQVNEHIYQQMCKFRGVRAHTRASAMASSHVRSTVSGFNNAKENAPEMFKMSQFKQVKSRVGNWHVNPRAKSAVKK